MATDFEDASEDTLQMALVLAKEFESEIILVHVIPEIKDFQMARGKIKKSGRRVEAHGDGSAWRM